MLRSEVALKYLFGIFSLCHGLTCVSNCMSLQSLSFFIFISDFHLGCKSQKSALAHNRLSSRNFLERMNWTNI
jgi:hypothetical protein